jgi:hypothetical protein
MTDLKHVAIVPISPYAKEHEITVVAAALQKQVLRDFAPVWGVSATVDYFPTPESVPLGYWPLFIVEDAPAVGTHIDHAGQPVAFVELGVSWSLPASHEVLEMLADPLGTRLVPGDAPVGDERVEFLVEVCDPCQDPAYAYTVNGVLVSDFYTPAYFEPAFTQGSKYSFSGQLRTPRDVLPGGYLTWRNLTTGHWHQLKSDGTVADLGTIHGTLGFRGEIDQRSPSRRELSHLGSEHARMRAVSARERANRTAIEHRSTAWRDLIATVARPRG